MAAKLGTNRAKSPFPHPAPVHQGLISERNASRMKANEDV
jgi:hypothetical protein